MQNNNKNIAIKVENISKIYKLYDSSKHRFKEVFHPLRKKYHREFFALIDVSFEIRRGETVGIIGRNGSGKSTLLQLITSVLTPSSGQIKTEGKISALLELGAGFNPEFTGMENIFLNGTMLGFTRNEMLDKVDDIIEFAEIGQYIDQPVKSYSSGMSVRLAFAVAINVDPDILIVDEALAVGDARFQLKCFMKFQDFQKSGKTILFVSHDTSTINQYCSRAILLEEGQKIDDGLPKDVVNHYIKVLFPAKNSNLNFSDNQDSQIVTEEKKDIFSTKNEFRYGNNKGSIEDQTLLVYREEKWQETNQFFPGEDSIVSFQVFASQDILKPVMAMTIKNYKGLEIYGTNTLYQNIDVPDLRGNQLFKIKFRQKILLAPGAYFVSLGFVEIADGIIEPIDRRYDVLEFEVMSNQPVLGVANLLSKIEIS